MGMKVPRHIAERIRAGADLGFECDDEGNVVGGFQQAWGESAYPPPGYLPWNRLDVGNGDTFGFYWPIGKEAGPPIVCTIMHDQWQLAPLASSLESAIRLHITAGPEGEGRVVPAEDVGVGQEGCVTRAMKLE